MDDLVDALSLKRGVVSIVGAGGKTTLMLHLARQLSRAGYPVLVTTTTKLYAPSPDQVPVCLLAEDASDLIRQWMALSPPPPWVMAASGILPESRPEKLIGFPPGAIDRLSAAHIFRWILVEADGAAGRSLKAPADHEPVIPESSGAVIAVAGLDVIGKPLHDAHVFRAARFARLTGLAMGDPVTAASVAAAVLHPEGLFKGSPDSAQKIVYLNKAEGQTRRSAGREMAAILAAADSHRPDRVVMGSLLSQPVFAGTLNG